MKTLTDIQIHSHIPLPETAHDPSLTLTQSVLYALLNGTVPDNLKIGKVLPVFKKGDHTLMTNYRPI